MKIIKVVAGLIWLPVLIYLLFWSDISRSDFYQRNFNKTVWEQKQRDIEISNEIFHNKLAELDNAKCEILLQAHELIVPIEIERSVLFGISKDFAQEMEFKELELDRELCHKHGIAWSGTRTTE